MDNTSESFPSSSGGSLLGGSSNADLIDDE
jgi:hypothetical protein